MITTDFDFTAINAKLDKITDAAKAGARPAAQAGSQVFYDELLTRVPVGTQEHSTKGKKQTFQPGNLRDAMYQAFAAEESAATGVATYRISWNKKKAFYGAFVEFGTSSSAAQPFLRPTYDSALNRAVSAAQARMAQEVKKALP